MKYQIRRNIWETNSSSVHTLQISDDNMSVSELDVHSDGYVYVELDEYYGKDCKDYDTQMDKLKYVCTWFLVYYGFDVEKLINDGWSCWTDFVSKFCEWVNETGGWYNEVKCIGIKIIPKLGFEQWDYLDHQNQAYGMFDEEHCIVDLYHPDMLVNFIFNPYLWLHTDCD